ncbi:hypothetical protein CR513_34024, partial [Mucuna pruriens]
VKLKRVLIARIRGRRIKNPYIETLKQLEFELLSSQVNTLPEDQYLGYFTGGLQSNIKCRIHTFNPKSCLQAMQLARDIETKMAEIHPKTSSYTWQSKNWQQNSTAWLSKLKQGGNNINSGSVASSFSQNRDLASVFLSTGRKNEGDQRNSVEKKIKGLLHLTYQKLERKIK